jgi:hypothetical protein
MGELRTCGRGIDISEGLKKVFWRLAKLTTLAA